MQKNYVDQKYGMFLHFNMGTYTGQDWSNGNLNPNLFNPTGINTDQWADTAVAAGMKYGVLTVKHCDGFALFDSPKTIYDVANPANSWYQGRVAAGKQGDVVKMYADSFRSRGLGVGLYYSIWDVPNHIGDGSSAQLSGANATAYVKAELHDLLTNYGPIEVLWTDGWGWKYGLNYPYVDYPSVYNYIKQISPNTLLMENNHQGNLTHSDIVGYEIPDPTLPMPPVGNTVPAEACQRLSAQWFYHDTRHAELRSASYVATEARTVNSRNAAYLLDVTPDKTGVIPQVQVNRLNDIKAGLDAVSPLNLAFGKTATQSSTWASSTYTANKALDGDLTNFSHTAVGDYSPSWKIDLGKLTSIGKISLLNRESNGGRLRDITIKILAADGVTVLYTSDLLNPGNVLGGGLADYVNGPYTLSVTLPNGILGEFVVVSRTPQTGYATDSTGNKYLLSLSEVGVYAPVPEPSMCMLLGVGGLIAIGVCVRRRRGRVR